MEASESDPPGVPLVLRALHCLVCGATSPSPVTRAPQRSYPSEGPQHRLSPGPSLCLPLSLGVTVHSTFSSLITLVLPASHSEVGHEGCGGERIPTGFGFILNQLPARKLLVNHGEREEVTKRTGNV